ncbi:hypothetical protein [Oscillatoria sp. FACHB-1407]|uniref:hypothetical protein n=1 Tax=Oscillatoria sp. FACHB-1407 TaxID=2692847 RepID=UPI001A7EB7C2|nr:hypothetical protein [Oscillatoria sp. FACHB-1407]
MNPTAHWERYERQNQISNRFLSDEIIQLRTQARIISTIFLVIDAFLLYVLLAHLSNTQHDQKVCRSRCKRSWASSKLPDAATSFAPAGTLFPAGAKGSLCRPPYERYSILAR